MGFAQDAPLRYRLFQRALWILVRLLTRLDLAGVEHIPSEGPVVFTPNHIHMLEIPILGAVIPRRCSIFAADKWRGRFGGWLMESATHVIYVARGEADRVALASALEVLRRGGGLAVAPEGTRTHTGGLQEGKDGAAYLASRTRAAIVPVVVWGQEHILGAWLRLRRPVVHVRFGPALHLPAEAPRARLSELHRYTDEIMLAMAHMLPPEYRGVYADRLGGDA